MIVSCVIPNVSLFQQQEDLFLKNNMKTFCFDPHKAANTIPCSIYKSFSNASTFSTQIISEPQIIHSKPSNLRSSLSEKMFDELHIEKDSNKYLGKKFSPDQNIEVYNMESMQSNKKRKLENVQIKELTVKESEARKITESKRFLKIRLGYEREEQDNYNIFSHYVRSEY
jgi:hypothetical protein